MKEGVIIEDGMEKRETKTDRLSFLERLSLSSPLATVVIAFCAFLTVLGLIFNILLTPVKENIVRLKEDVTTLKKDIKILTEDVTTLKIGVSKIESKIDQVLTNQETIKK